MKKNKNNKKIIISVVVLILLIILGIFGFNKFSSKEQEVENKNFWDYDNTNKLKICKKNSFEDCQGPVYDYYDLIKIKYDYKVLNKELERVNKETLRLFEEAKKSDINDSTCDKVRNKYNYRLYNEVRFAPFENDFIISIAVHRKQTDLCTGEHKSLSYEAFTYDIKEKRLLTQEEIREIEQVTDEEIANTIKVATERLSKDENKEYELQNNYNDVILFYSEGGNLIIAFKIPGEDIYLDSGLERI